MTYLVCYSWYGKERAQNKITLKLLGMDAAPVGASAWLVNYPDKATQLRNELEPHLDGVCHLIVTEFNSENSAWTENPQNIAGYIEA